MLRKNKKGFTLIELLVVVIIVAVLAAVATPLLTGNIKRAKASEAEAGIGTIRTGVRSYIAEHSTVPGALTLTQVGINATDVNGRYFSSAAYSIVPTASTTNYFVNCNGATSDAGIAPRAAEVQGANLIQRSMNQDGTITDGLTGAGTVLN